MSVTVGSMDVLHVDDDADFAELVATYLERENERIEVTVATSAAEGLDHLDERDVDCVVSDHDMPSMDGLEFLGAVREEHPDLPFILFTGKGSEEIASEAISAGVTDYLQKEGGTDQFAVLANRIANAVEQYAVRTEIQRRERRLQALLERSADRVSIVDENGVYQFVSPAVERMMGYAPEELIGESGFEYVHPDDRDRVEAAFEEVLAGTRDGESIEYRFRHEDGSWRWVEARGNNCLDDPAIEGVVVNSWDVTDRKERERELRANRERFRLVQQYAHIGYWELDLRTDPPYDAYLSEGTYRIHDASPEDDFTFETGLEFYHPDDRPRVRETVGRAIEDEESFAVEARLRTETGDFRWVRLTGEPVEEDGEVTKLRGALQDVTDRKEREQELVRTQRRFEAVFNTPDSFIGVLDADGTLLEANRTALEFAGVDAADVEGEPFWETPWWDHSGRLQERLREWIERAVDGEYVRGDAVHRSPDGREATVDVAFRPVTDDDGSVVSIIAEGRDITEHKRRERAVEALHAVAQQFAQAETGERVVEIAVEAARDILDMPITAVWIHDEDEDALRPAAKTDRATELLGELPTFRPGAGLGWEAFETGEKMLFEDVSDHPERYNPDTPARSEMILPLGDHGILIAGAPEPGVFDEMDVSMAEILAANTEAALTRAEREQAVREREAELRRQNERLDEFASIVSHDLRNPLNVAEGHLELLRGECDGEHLDAAARAHDRMESLIEDLLTLARQGKTVEGTEPVDLAATVRTCWGNVDTGEAALAVETDRSIRADESRLRQLLENLLRNAVEHGPPDVTISVGDLADGFYVADDGPGIPADERERVFESGYSTDEDGTGFGLSIVSRIADAHGWTVAVAESESGGARFEITGAEFAE